MASDNQGVNDFESKFDPDAEDLAVQEGKTELLKRKSTFDSNMFTAELIKKTGPVLSKMLAMTDFDDLSLMMKMEKHQHLILTLNELSVLMDVSKR